MHQVAIPMIMLCNKQFQTQWLTTVSHYSNSPCLQGNCSSVHLHKAWLDSSLAVGQLGLMVNFKSFIQPCSGHKRKDWTCFETSHGKGRMQPLPLTLLILVVLRAAHNQSSPLRCSRTGKITHGHLCKGRRPLLPCWGSVPTVTFFPWSVYGAALASISPMVKYPTPSLCPLLFKAQIDLLESSLPALCGAPTAGLELRLPTHVFLYPPREKKKCLYTSQIDNFLGKKKSPFHLLNQSLGFSGRVRLVISFGLRSKYCSVQPLASLAKMELALLYRTCGQLTSIVPDLKSP